MEETNAMTVSAIGRDGFSKKSIGPVKKIFRRGVCFLHQLCLRKRTGYSRIVVFVCLWHGLEQQIIIKGNAEKIAENLSDGYFESRPKGSKLGAWASSQV